MSAKASILVVDDDPYIRESLSGILKARGYVPTESATGQAALDSIEKEKPAVAVIDLRLDDMPGLEVMRKIKKCSPDTECIVLTGQASQASAIEAVNLGAYSYVQKPYDVDQLLVTIRRAIEKREAEEALRRRTAQLEALRQVGLELAAQLELNALLRSIASRAMELLEGIGGSLALYRPEQDVLETVMIVGDVAVPAGSTFRRGEGLAGKVWETGEPLAVSNYEHWEGQTAAYEGLPSPAVVGVPVRWGPAGAGEEFLGVLIVQARPQHAFSPADTELLSMFANQAATAIHNAWLYEAERRRRQEAETLRETALVLTAALDRDEVIERILAQLQEVVPYDSASVQLFREGRMEIVGGRGFPNLPDLLGLSFPVGGDNPNSEVVRTRASFIVEDAPAAYGGFRREPHVQAGIHSWLGVPMLAGERLVGMIALDKRGPGFYTQEHARLAEAFAAQAATAFENSRLFQAEREQRELAEALEDAAAAVSSSLDFDYVMDQILEQVERVVPGDAFNIMLVQEDSTVRVVRWRGYEHLGVEDAISRFAAPIADHPKLVKMIQTGKPLTALDSSADPDWVPLAGWEWLRSYVGAPIQVTGVTVGFLNVVGTRPGQFGPADAQHLGAFAHHAATAVENAQLYREQYSHAEQLEQRVLERTAQLQAQYARLEAILRSTADGILVTDREGKILQANPVVQTWLTKTLSPEDADRLLEVVRDLARRTGAAAAPGERQETVLELTGLDLELKAAPISEPGAKETEAVVAIHDVSHLKALDRMRSRFVSDVSHELRTPITTIQLYAALMQRTPPERWGEYLNTLAQEADRQARLVENIMQISRIDAGRLEMESRPTPLNELTETAIVTHNILAQEQDLTLEHRPAEPGPVALVDAERMMQVLNNLVGNAIQYTPERGRITVSTGKAKADGRVWATATVADTGIGIPQEELPHIFERFFRGEEPRLMQIPGTGLGLTMVKEIVELNGGRVTVESQVGKGTTFTVWLPLA